MKRIDDLSGRLRATRSKFADFRHGGVVMSSEEVEHLVRKLDGFTEMAEAMEEALMTLRSMDPAELRSTMTPAGAKILHLMQPGTNIVPFPGKPHA